MNRLIESLMESLHEVYARPELPVQAGLEFATRSTSLATGTSGLNFALIETGLSLGGLQIDASQCSNIFAAEIVADSKRLNFYSSASTGPEPLGDIFNGVANKVWTDLVFRRDSRRVIKNLAPSDVVRPGLGHGDLIRDLAVWLSADYPNSRIFKTSETTFDGLGWCNGRAGLLAAQAIVFQMTGDERKRDFVVKLATELLDALEHNGPGMEYGLCHGWSGVLVITNSVGGLLGNKGILDRSRSLFENLLIQESLLELPPDLLVDSSWLTGSAGLIWAWTTLNTTPCINPLMPFYARVYV